MVRTSQEAWCFTKEKIVNSGISKEVIGEDGKQILVKHGSTYVRVQTCRITDPINSEQNEIHRSNHNYRKNSVMKPNQVK